MISLESKIGKFYIITPAGEKIGPPKTPEEIQLVTQVYFPEPGTKLEEAMTGVQLSWEEFEAEFILGGVIVLQSTPQKEPAVKKFIDFFSLSSLGIIIPFAFFSYTIEDKSTAFAILFFGGTAVLALQIFRRFFA